MFRLLDGPGWGRALGPSTGIYSVSISDRGALKVFEQEFKLVESGRKGWKIKAIRL